MDKLDELGLLASALAGRPIQLQQLMQNRLEDKYPSDAAWTDGRTLYLRSGRMGAPLLQELCVQCALLAAGSLHHEVMKKLLRKPGLTQRYLVVEGARALSQIELISPCSMRSLCGDLAIPESDSVWGSLAIATSKRELPPVPDVFGAIRPKQVLKTLQQHGGAISAGVHVPRSAPSTPTTELMDDPDREEEYDRTAETDHDFSSPVGGGGAIGRLLQRLFSMVRDVKGGDSPGADAASHWTRSGTRAGTRAVYSVLDIDTLRHTSSSESDGGVRTGGGLLYPEWNCHRHRYHPAWCTVQELDVTLDHSVTVEWAQQHQLRRPLLRLARGMMRHPRQRQGDDIDIDAVIESQLGVGAGLPQDEAVYLESQRRRRDLSVLILLDISGSVAQPGVDGVAIHEQQRKVAASLLRALHEVGDRVALYGFHSQGKSEVHLAAVKRFDEVLGSTVMKRLFSLKPGAYSRLGAAVRHGVSQLLEQGGTPRKLLLVISDGLAYDHGYEPVYAAADVHQALGEARTHGVGCVCLGVGSMTEVEALQQVFGSAAYAVIPHPQDISRCIGPLFETALMNAEIQRQIA